MSIHSTTTLLYRSEPKDIVQMQRLSASGDRDRYPDKYSPRLYSVSVQIFPIAVCAVSAVLKRSKDLKWIL